MLGLLPTGTWYSTPKTSFDAKRRGFNSGTTCFCAVLLVHLLSDWYHLLPSALVRAWSCLLCLTFVVGGGQVNGIPTPTLDAFLDVVRHIGDKSPARVKTVSD